MQLKISTDYAIRIVLYLAITQTAATSAEISAQMGIPQTVIATRARPLQEASCRACALALSRSMSFTSLSLFRVCYASARRDAMVFCLNASSK